MNRRSLALLTAWVTLALLVAVSAPAFSQQPAGVSALPVAEGVAAPAAEPPPETAPAAGAEEPARPAPAGSDTVETILRQQEELLRGQSFSYDPQGRRDPFQSLFETVSKKVPRDQRPRGVAGMLIAEIDLDGIVRDPDSGDMAFFKGSDNKGYFLRVGDAVFDGKLIAIDSRRGVVTFRQQVDDPRMIKPYRDVVMRLEATTENEESTHE